MIRKKILETLQNPELFSKSFLKLISKEQRLIPFEWNEAQKKFYRERTGYDIILKSRQIGFSTLAQALIFHSVVTSTQSAIILAHDSSTTEKLRLIQDRFYDNFPTNLREFHRPERKYANATLTTYPETNSTITIATAGNLNIGRGGTYSIFHGSEVAFWSNPEEIIAGALQGMAKPNIILESTPNGTQGWFYETVMDSLAGRGIWKVHFFPWFEIPEYNIPGWKEKKLLELKNDFYQEYPEDIATCFKTSNTGYFSDIQVDYSATSEYDPTHRYTGGLDFGQTNDFTCLIVVDRTTRQMVDFLHINKMGWAEQRAEIKKIYNKWRLTGLRGERNSIGSVNIEELERDGVNIESFNTTNSSKAQIMQQLHEELESGFKLMNWPVLKAELNTMTSKQTATGKWTISADGNNHDDTVISLALACSAKIDQQRRARSWV